MGLDGGNVLEGLNEDFRVIPGMGEFGDRYFGTDDDDEQVVVSSQ